MWLPVILRIREHVLQVGLPLHGEPLLGNRLAGNAPELHEVPLVAEVIEAVAAEIALWRVLTQALRQKCAVDVTNGCIYCEEELPCTGRPDAPGETGVNIHAVSRILRVERPLAIIGVCRAPEVWRKMQWCSKCELEKRKRNWAGLLCQVGKIDNRRLIARGQDRHVRHEPALKSGKGCVSRDSDGVAGTGAHKRDRLPQLIAEGLDKLVEVLVIGLPLRQTANIQQTISERKLLLVGNRKKIRPHRRDTCSVATSSRVHHHSLS